MKHLVRILFILMLALPLTVFAQSETDVTIDDIENAFANLFKNDSVRVEGSTVIDQNITVMGQTTVQSVVQELSGEMSFADAELTGLSAQLNQSTVAESMGNTFEGAMLMELIYVDGALYLRISETTGIMEGIYPENWINVEEEAATIPGMELFNVDTLLASFNKPLMYPLNEETVLSLSAFEYDPEEVTVPEGTVAYTLEIDVQAAFASGEIASMFSSFESMGVDMEDLLNQMVEGAVLEVVVYLNEGQLVRIESVLGIDVEIDFSGQKVQMVQTSSGVFNYVEFNFPVEITAPEN